MAFLMHWPVFFPKSEFFSKILEGDAFDLRFMTHPKVNP